MSKKTFTEKEIKELSINPFVKAVSGKGITYTDEFKRLFIAEKESGKFSRQIFEEAGFDTNIIGMTRI
ncbi:HTH domain-containing protein, partial [Cytobacillus gottheilii]|uniref:HTH domain-containing protein n=1 Tax=Cytobacillus gottheilii TaxID=859144 RepID=UPI003CF86C3D